MKLTLEFLKARHDFWKRSIGEAGIWEENKFSDVVIKLRPRSKNYNGLFSRRVRVIKGVKKQEDRIFIYKNSEEFDPVFLDSVLVHEMIHQYICQCGIKDTSVHGKIFKLFMGRINSAFPGQLKINIKDHNPHVPLRGEGDTEHLLMMIHSARDIYFCVINPSAKNSIEALAKRFLKTGKIKNFTWASSRDNYFSGFSRCTRALHGIKVSLSEKDNFMSEYGVKETINKKGGRGYKEKWLTLRKSWL